MAVIGTAGHVDHGKSTLVERLTGIDPDRFEEEKRRGLTIDLGFAWLTLPSGRDVGVVDVPGHERFIRNMLAGAGSISTCLFVVAANEGWKPQSSEHLAILDILGVRRGVVALTKSDTVDADALAALERDVSERLARTSLAGVPIVPCSAVTGEGVDDLLAALDSQIEEAEAPDDASATRLWIDRVFTIAGAGTVVTGTLGDGTLEVGAEVEVSPASKRARIRSIQTHKRDTKRVGPGTRVALNLVGLERTGAERGNAIVQPGSWPATRRVDALVRVLPQWASGSHELTTKGSHLFYAGSAETPVRVRLLDAHALNSGEEGLARLTLREPLPLRRGDRFVLRDAGRVLTFGGGTILDPLPRAAHVGLLSALRGASSDAALNAIVESAGRIDRREALFRAGARRARADVPDLGGTLVSSSHLGSLKERLRAELDERHAAAPLERGISREEVRAALDLDRPVFDALVAATEDVAEDRELLTLEGHSVRLNPEQERARAELLARLDAEPFMPPLISDLNSPPELLRSLEHSGDIVRVGPFFLTATSAHEARTRVRAFVAGQGGATVAQIRDLLGTSRKYAVPLCEWLDASGVTIRRGDVRVLGPRA